MSNICAVTLIILLARCTAALRLDQQFLTYHLSPELPTGGQQRHNDRQDDDGCQMGPTYWCQSDDHIKVCRKYTQAAMRAFN
jgi:hypothetical protein